VPDDELTPPDDWNGEKNEEPEEPDELDVAELELPVLELADPGMVDALTTASTPTPAIAPIATPVVSRFSICIASSRAITRALLALSSMVCILGDGSEPCLRGS
jgi:hypothetical protein